MKKPYIIAEVGVNYYDTAEELKISPIDAAKLYIKKAKEAGVDAVKFQSYKANKIASKDSPAYWDTSKETTKSQFELFQKFDHFGKEEYQELAEYCRMENVDFLSTPFDFEAADYLNEIMDIFKISSSDITNLPFLEYIARKRKPIILSVGASNMMEVEQAVSLILDSGCPELSLLHCVLSYPCNNEDANLNVIKHLKRVYPELKIGYSDHTLPDEDMLILTTAYLYGAEIIEKHFTLNKELQGNDHYHAGDPEDFKKFIHNLELINIISGSEQKRVFACEQIPRREARRSLVIGQDMKAGEMITRDKLTAKRPGKGVSPQYLDIVEGKTLLQDAKEDTILTWDMV